MEIWKPVKDYEGLYEVSSLGRVKSLKFGKERILRIALDKRGYLTCVLYLNRCKKTRTVHQLVAESFLGHTPCELKLVVDHINNVRNDNRVENLQIVTNRYNAYKTQMKYSSKFKGVSWSKHTNKWISRIIINNKSHLLGYFKCELAAHQAYQNKLKEII